MRNTGATGNRIKTNTFKVLAIIICLTQIISCFSIIAIAADNDEYEKVYISSIEDYKKVLESCTDDIWSKDKKVILKSDLDFTGTDFSSIPLFAGVFDGNGHTISGISYEKDGSQVGLIRWILPGGIVKNLTVSGILKPTGTSKTIGGIAGINEGIIENCKFEGTITANSQIGGVAGTNRAGGKISNCEVSGKINGFHQTGGICGQNYGSIEKCHNFASVNKDYRTEVGGTIPDSGENLLGITDIGGISGINNSIISSCINDGNIGYPKVGYRVGGITGCQYGIAVDCSNNSLVQGRRDVGGIAGKLIPEAFWNNPQSRTSELQFQMDKLENALNLMLENIIKNQATTGKDFDEILSSIEKSEQALDRLSSETENFINGNIDTLNEILDLCDTLIKGLEPIGKRLSDFTAELSKVFKNLSDATDSLKSSMETASPAVDEIQLMLDDVISAMKEIDDANQNLKTAFEHFNASFGDTKKVEAALKEISNGFTSLSASVQKIADRLSNIKITPPSGGSELIKSIQALLEALGQIGNAMNDLSGDFKNISASLEKISSGFSIIEQEFTVEELKLGLQSLRKAIAKLENLPPIVESATSHLNESINHLKNAQPQMENALLALSKAFTSMENASNILKDTINLSTELEKKLSQLSKINFSKLTPEFSYARKDLFESLKKLTDSIKKFSSDLTGNSVVKDLQNVTTELFLTIESLKNILLNFDLSSNDEPLFRDISPNVKGHSNHDKGVILSCVNFGAIKGDTYVGGIIGSIELDKKITKEDIPDLSLILQGNAEYSIYASVRLCLSYSSITAEKESAGGIVGNMAYGLIEDCMSTGEMNSNGSYVGGIAGSSNAYIRKCRSRTFTSGKSYIGGICGEGHYISECLALPYMVNDGEYRGAIAGNTDDYVLNNFYADCNIGGINGFSFSGQAECISYEDLTDLDVTSSIFRSVTVSFVLDDGSIIKKEIEYGSALMDLPFVQNVNGLYWKWDKLDDSIKHDTTVYGKYCYPRTSIATDEGKPYFVVEGSFTNDSVITIKEYAPHSVPKKATDLTRLGAHTVTVSDASSLLKVRYLEDKNGILFVLGKDGSLVETEYTRDGSYIVFEMENGGSFLYTEKATSILPLILTGIFIGVALMGVIALTVVFVKRKKKKKNKTRNKSETEELQEDTNHLS